MQTLLTGDFLKLQNVYFRVIGFNIMTQRHGWPNPWRTLGSMLILGIVHVMAIVYAIQDLGNIQKLTEGLAALLLNHLGLFKFGIMIYMHKNFCQLIAELRQLLESECESQVSAEIIAQENQREQRISVIYKNSFLLAGVLSSLKPCMGLVLTYYLTGEVFLDLSCFPCAYPWDNRKLHFALFSNALVACASFAVVLSAICIDTLYISLVYNLVALFKIAQHRMQLCSTKLELREVLNLYKRSLDASYVVNRYFRLLICTQLLVGSLHLCVLTYSISDKIDDPQMPFYVAFAISVLAQLYLYCSCGEYLKTESRGFARAIYDSPWYEAIYTSPESGPSLQFSMMRAQRGSCIDGFFFEANMEVFLSIVRTAMSYFTLLNSIS